MKSNNPVKTLNRQQNFVNRFTSLAFDDQAAIIYGRIRAILSKARTLIGSNDLQIAACCARVAAKLADPCGIAIANNLILVTHNVSEFSRVIELNWEDWEQ